MSYLFLNLSSFLQTFLVTLTLAFSLSTWAADGLRFERLFGPEVPTGDYKHPASATELANGDLFVAFFSGKGEYKDATAAVFGSRLKLGSKEWSRPVKIASKFDTGS